MPKRDSFRRFYSLSPLPFPRPFVRLLPFLGILTMAGCFDRVAGTSTTAENTITGVARLPGGGPAAGALVSARAPAVILSRNRVPESRLLGLTYTDSLGRFQVKLPKAEACFLEIRRVPTGPADSATAPRETWFGAFPIPTSEPRDLGALNLAPPGTVRGTLRTEGGPPVGRVWIGLEGTDNFGVAVAQTGVDSAGMMFSLKDVPAGPHKLVVWVEPAISIDLVDLEVPVDSVKAFTAAPGGADDLGTVYVKKP